MKENSGKFLWIIEKAEFDEEKLSSNFVTDLEIFEIEIISINCF